jgi:hypothetical protein
MRDQRLELRDIVKHIDDAILGRLDVPEFQRKFVWTPEKTKKFVDSLWRGYPVGALLLWESAYDQPKTAMGVQTSKLWIVDGQQRVTSLSLIFGKKPYWWGEAIEWNRCLQKHDVLARMNGGGQEVEFALPNPVRKGSPDWVSVRRILSEANLSQLANDISKQNGSQDFASIHETLQSIKRIENFPIFEIIIDHELEDVAEIFSRLNTAGTKIRESDVILALVASKQEGWVREEFDRFLKDLNDAGFELDPSVLIRSLAAVGKSAARLRDIPKGFWEKSKEFDNAWRTTKESIAFVHKNLEAQGILASDLLPAHNALIPLFYLHAKFQKTFHFKQGLRWLLLAIGDGRYSGSATTTLDQDIKLVKGCASFQEAVEKLQVQLRIRATFENTDFIADYSDDFLRLMFYLAVFQAGARDWLYQDIQIGFDRADNALNEGFKPEWHHFFPKKVLRGRVEDAKINSLANIVVLNEKANRSFSSKQPKQYLKENGVENDRLKEQFIPLETSLWEVDHYGEFLDARARALAKACTEFLEGLG